MSSRGKQAEATGVWVPDSWLTVGQAAMQLQRSAQRVRQFAENGRLQSVKTRLGRLIDPASLERLLETRTRVGQVTPTQKAEALPA